MRVNAARRHQPHDMHAPARRLDLGHDAARGDQLLERAVGRRCVDLGEILHHNTAGADIEVANLRVAHLALRQPNVEPGRFEEGMRPRLPQPIEIRRAGKANGIIGPLLPPAPAIENNKHHGARRDHRLVPSLEHRVTVTKAIGDAFASPGGAKPPVARRQGERPTSGPPPGPAWKPNFQPDRSRLLLRTTNINQTGRRPCEPPSCTRPTSPSSSRT